MGKTEGERGARHEWRRLRFGGAGDGSILECESDQPNREAETVMEFNDQRILLRKG